MTKCGSRASARERCGDAEGKLNPTTAVRYGKMGFVGEFSHPPDMKLSCGAAVVISTDRGIELGKQLNRTCFGCEQAISREQMQDYADASEGGEAFRPRNGRILREANESDLVELHHIGGSETERLEVCRRFAREFDLNMKIVDCEQVLGGERIIFYFMAEERVDFRQLVRRLAGEFQTRIEMRQIGARDEARLLADYETCGRECCCKNFLKSLKPIGMSMAKQQKTTLDVAKVSGRCGRLKCCLRYEHESYATLDKLLPRNGTWVSTDQGIGRVVDRQILTQLVAIRTEEGQLVSVAAEDIRETNLPAPKLEPPPAAGGRGPGSATSRRPGAVRPGKPTLPPGRDQAEATDSAPPAPPQTDDRGVNDTGGSPLHESPKRPAPNPASGEGTSGSRRRRGRRSRRGRSSKGGDRSSDSSSGG